MANERSRRRCETRNQSRNLTPALSIVRTREIEHDGAGEAGIPPNGIVDLSRLEGAQIARDEHEGGPTEVGFFGGARRDANLEPSVRAIGGSGTRQSSRGWNDDVCR